MPQDIQIQADWLQNDSTQIDYIKHKPNLYEEWWGTQVEYDAIVTKDPDVIYNIITPEQINYFYIEDASGSDNTLSIVKNSGSAPTVEVFKSTDGTNWSSMGNTDTTAITATVPANGKLYLKATTNAWSMNKISATENHNVGGNIMSLLYGDNFEGQTTFPLNSLANFTSLFYRNGKLINASALELPATVMTTSCYRDMFNGCTSLTTTPILPATTMDENCYWGMFYGCTSLTTAPVLPATTLFRESYRDMFNGCTSLTTAPALPATSLGNHCYYCMFGACTSLTTAPALPATTLANNCYRGMFSGCTGLTSTPVLVATNLVSTCYRDMFNGCTSLNTVTTYANDISASNCLYNWLDGTAATGDFFNLGTATYSSGTSGIPSGWTEHTSL